MEIDAFIEELVRMVELDIGIGQWRE